MSLLACTGLFEDDDDDDDDDDDSVAEDAAGPSAAADTDTDADSDSDSDSDSDADMPMREPDVTWDSGGMDISVRGFTAFGLSLAETGIGEGWYGESCVEEQSGYRICHTFEGDRGFLNRVYDPDDVVDGETTLFSSESASGVTLMVYDPQAREVDPTTCWYGGDDVSYYQDFGYDCAE